MTSTQNKKPTRRPGAPKAAHLPACSQPLEDGRETRRTPVEWRRAGMEGAHGGAMGAGVPRIQAAPVDAMVCVAACAVFTLDGALFDPENTSGHRSSMYWRRAGGISFRQADTAWGVHLNTCANRTGPPSRSMISLSVIVMWRIKAYFPRTKQACFTSSVKIGA